MDELTEAVVTDLCDSVSSLEVRVRKLKDELGSKVEAIYERWLEESDGPYVMDGSAAQFKDYLVRTLK